jgi:flagellar hook-associated protein 3 FlgL
MRVTTEMQSQQALLNVQASYGRLTQLQNQITSGNQINSASDNPTGMVQILQNNAQNNQLTTYLSTIQSASNVLQSSVSALQNVQTTLTSAITAAQTAANASTSSSSYSSLAAQVNTALNEIVGLANTQLSDGTYIFGGTASNKSPFTVTSTDANGQTTGVAYQGNQTSSQVIVGQGVTVNTLISGSSVFQPTVGGTTTYSGSTGAAAGTGTDTATGQGTLTVQHVLTTFAGTSGVAAGSSSAAGDTIIGPAGANSLVIDDTSGTGAGGTVSLNGGTAVAFTNSDTNLAVTGPNGEVVYLDMSNITPGFNSSVSLTATGTISTDGGATTVPINFGSNQIVTDSTTGATTNVNTANIRQAGTDQLSYPGQSDLFQTLIALRDTINNTQGLSASDRTTAINQQLAALQKINTSIGTPMGTQSSQAQYLSNLKTRATNLQTSVQQATSTLNSTDMATVLVQLQQQQTLYQAGLEIAAGLNQMNLANYIST